MRSENDLSIKDYFQYDPETGIISNVISIGRWGRTKPGTPLGTINSNGYLVINLFGKLYYNHRLAYELMTGKSAEIVDHINGIRNDNRWINLRSVDPAQSTWNQKLSSTNKSGCQNVHWNKATRSWRVRIKCRGKAIQIGMFDSLEEANQAAIEAKERYHGKDFSRKS